MSVGDDPLYLTHGIAAEWPLHLQPSAIPYPHVGRRFSDPNVASYRYTVDLSHVTMS